MRKYFFLLAILILLTGCGVKQMDTTNDMNLSTNEDNSTNDSDLVDTYEDNSTNNNITIKFDNEISSDGNVNIDGNTATITEAGTYIITGSNTDAQLIIDAPEEDVELILKDLTLTSNNSSAITGINANNLNITLEGNNTLSDTTNNTDEYQAPIYIDEIETHIDGEGTLTLNGNYQEGFESNNDLYIDGGTFYVNAIDDGLNTGDALIINGGTLYINSNGDGLDSNGDLEINGGTTYVSSGNNGNGPLDYGDSGEYTFKLNGGTLIALGGTMAVAPTSNSQEFLNGTSNGTTITVEDTTYTAPKNFSYFFVSSPTLTTSDEIQVDSQVVSATSTIASNNVGAMNDPHGKPNNF